MRLLFPEILWLLIPLALFGWLRYREALAVELPVHPRTILDNRRTLLVRIAPYVALGWMIVALARPVTVRERVEETPGLPTLYLALDASRSMQGTDLAPNRFAFAKAAIERLIEKDRRHRFGLLVFTTNALILSPPTEDRRLLRAALGAFNPDFILTHGTSLEALLRYVAKLSGERRELVIFSDGGDDENLGRLVAIAQDHGIRVDAVACATPEGSKIPDGNGWLRESGRLVVSVLNPQLGRLALETGGVFVDERDPVRAAEALMEELEPSREASRSERVRYGELFWIPLTLGIGFFLAGTLGFGAAGRRRDAKSRRSPASIGDGVSSPEGPRAFGARWGGFRRIFAAVSLFLGLQQAEAGWLDLWRLHRGYEAYAKGDYNASKAIFEAIRPPLLESTYALANTYYRLGAYKKAGRLYLRCQSDDPAVKRRIWYNLGNCAMKLGHYKSARDYYVKALQLGEDPDALENLRLALFLQERRRKRVEARAEKKVAAQSGSGASEQREKGSKTSKSQARTGQGSGSRSSAESSRVGPKKERIEATERYELGSKAYELINKGYVHEKRAW